MPGESTQFKKGQSGNPKGRKKGTLSLTTLLRKELARIVDDGKGNKTQRAIRFVQKLMDNADAGNGVAIREVYNRVEGVQAKTLKIEGLAVEKLASLAEMTAEFLPEERFDEWFQRATLILIPQSSELAPLAEDDTD